MYVEAFRSEVQRRQNAIIFQLEGYNMSKKNSSIKFKEKPVDFLLVIDVLIMLALGVVMVLSASSPSALAESGNSYAYVKKQGFAAIVRLNFDDYNF